MPTGPLMTPRALDTALGRGVISPLYILDAGGKGPPDMIAIERCLETIQGAVLAGEENDWNLTRLSGERVEVNEILDASMTLPLLGGRRLVVVRGASDIGAAGSEAARKDQARRIREMAREKDPPVVVVLVTPPLDGRLAVHKALVASASVVSCGAPTARDMPAWIRTEAEAAGLALARETAELLAEIVGTDTLRARHEIDKLALYKGGTRKVTPADVGALASGGTLADTWRMCDAVAGLDEAAALRMARELLDGGEKPEPIIGALAFRVRQMVQAAEALEAGGGKGAALGAVRAWGPTREVLGAAMPRYDPAGLRACLRILRASDRTSKRGSDSRAVVLSAISRIVRAASGRLPTAL